MPKYTVVVSSVGLKGGEYTANTPREAAEKAGKKLFVRLGDANRRSITFTIREVKQKREYKYSISKKNNKFVLKSAMTGGDGLLDPMTAPPMSPSMMQDMNITNSMKNMMNTIKAPSMSQGMMPGMMNMMP